MTRTGKAAGQAERDENGAEAASAKNTTKYKAGLQLVVCVRAAAAVVRSTVSLITALACVCACVRTRDAQPIGGLCIAI